VAWSRLGAIPWPSATESVVAASVPLKDIIGDGHNQVALGLAVMVVVGTASGLLTLMLAAGIAAVLTMQSRARLDV
jgi:hypothetical protein